MRTHLSKEGIKQKIISKQKLWIVDIISKCKRKITNKKKESGENNKLVSHMMIPMCQDYHKTLSMLLGNVK